MMRNILRASRCLVRRKINNSSILYCMLNKSFIEKNVTSSYSIPLSKFFSTSSSDPPSSEHVDQVVYEEICKNTLESLCDYFEQIVDESTNLKGADVTFSDGVLTVAFGPNYGTYVINRQTPNKQIWLSSPISGPKRYDLMLDNGGYWIYKHDGVSLHRLLQDEISKIVNNVDFNNCAHSLI